jgi:soluble lytic murein transglycosylase
MAPLAAWAQGATTPEPSPATPAPATTTPAPTAAAEPQAPEPIKGTKPTGDDDAGTAATKDSGKRGDEDVRTAPPGNPSGAANNAPPTPSATSAAPPGPPTRRGLGSRGTTAATLPAATPGVTPPAPSGTASSPNAPETLVPAAFSAGHKLVLEAREAFRRRDATRLATLRSALHTQGHPLTSWVDYWEMHARLGSLNAEEVEAFYTRWRGRYVEDRLRNDWLLELGRRRAWTAFANDLPRFRMNDDREVTCYALLAQHLNAKTAAASTNATTKTSALDAWLEQRDADDGCHLMASTLLDAKVFSQDEVWAKVRHAVDMGRLRSARHASSLLGDAQADAVAEALQNPTRFLGEARGDKVGKPSRLIKTAKLPEPGRASPASDNKKDATRRHPAVIALAIARVAQTDVEDAANTLRERWTQALPAPLLAWAWSQVAEQSALRHQAQALDHYKEAIKAHDQAKPRSSRLDGFGEDALGWLVRAALRSPEPARWALVQRAIESMRPASITAEPAWTYWLSRAQAQNAKLGADGDEQRKASKQGLMSLAPEIHFYGLLAAEELGQGFTPPPPAAPSSDDERQAARDHAGLRSGLLMLAIGLRDEGVREWNYSLRGMDDRALIAAAQWACERQVWDRCINTSDRTRTMADLSQRFPTPFLKELSTRTREIGLDAAYVYGLIRQESRFITDARSHVGASGLMQLMPGTAKWTANKIGVPYSRELITDPTLNMQLGTQYLKLVLDDFGGSQAMAAAAYNAGPSRPRRWREGAVMEAAAWAESIPFNETRDYVKKVLANTVIYSHLLASGGTGKAASAATSAPAPTVAPASSAASLAATTAPLATTLKGRLGLTIGPRESAAPQPNRDLP